MIQVEPSAAQAIRAFLAEKGFEGTVRIHLQSSGCCDPSLCLSVDKVRDSDLIYQQGELTFVISPEMEELAGDISIVPAEQNGRKGFILTSSRPISEWEGFAVTFIRS